MFEPNIAQPIVMCRLPETCKRSGHGRSSLYNAVNEGLFTPAVNIGIRSKAWPSHEVDAINAARIAGETDDEIRGLVRRLVAARANINTIRELTA